MSDVAVAAKATKAAAAPKAEPKLREVQPKKFPPSMLYPIGQDYEILNVTADADWTLEDLLAPIAWTNVCKKVARDPLNTRRDMLGSAIHVHTSDKSFFAILIINGVVFDNMNNPYGLDVQCIGPSIDPKTGRACPVNVKTGMPWSGKAA